jgi:chemotaxis protein MotB
VIQRALACSALLWIATGCVTQGTFDKVKRDRDRLDKVRIELEGRLERLAATNQSFDAERNALFEETEDLRIAKQRLERDTARLTREATQLGQDLESSQETLANRTAEIEKVRSTYDVLISDLEDEVASGQIQIEKLRSGLKMNLAEDILFASGSATVNSSGAALLRKVGGRLNELPYSVEVRGHTDNIPIGGRFPSNWELAAARASSVVRLLAQAGVDPVRLKVVSRAEYEPVASNDTVEGRAKNRRIEIRLEPSGSNSESAATEPEAEAGSGTGAVQAAPETPEDSNAAEVERAPAS